jgi:hypothetical protein
MPKSLPTPVFNDEKHHLRLYQGDCLEILSSIPENSVDLVFADPPYFLSNGGITCHAGKMVSVHKGDWDKSQGPAANHEFNTAWLAACQRVLKPNGSIWFPALLTSSIPSASPCSSSVYKLPSIRAWHTESSLSARPKTAQKASKSFIEGADF